MQTLTEIMTLHRRRLVARLLPRPERGDARDHAHYPRAAEMTTKQGATNMQTLTEIMTRHDVTIPAHLEAQAEVPLRRALQRQGDVMVRPMRPGSVAGLAPVPPEGVPVVRGEAGGNTHLLVAEGDVQWAPARTVEGIDLGVCVVPEGAAAWLLHPEHGAAGIAPGAYRITRQRQQADVVRLVSD